MLARLAIGDFCPSHSVQCPSVIAPYDFCLHFRHHMNMFRITLIAMSAAALAACASPAPPSASALNAKANQAFFAGRYAEALEGFVSARALANSTGDRQYEAISTFGMARANVQLCHFNAASDLFKDSIRLRSTLPDLQFAKATQNLVEYARFLLFIKRPQEAIPLMERAIPDLETSGIATTDPIAYAEFFDDYAAALKGVGRDTALAVTRAAKLRAENPGKTANFKPTPIPSACKAE
jgi:tetratricopeptide (TPR) repeat protein